MYVDVYCCWYLSLNHDIIENDQYNNKNTRVGFLRTQITWVKPYHLSAKCNVARRWWVRNEGYLGPQNTDEGVFIFILY